MSRTAVLGALALAIALGACRSQPAGPAIRVEDPWIRPALSGNTTAAYMVIHNDGGEADRMLSARMESAAAVEIHETVREGDLVRMVPRTQGLEIPPGAATALAPGGTHLMLKDLSADLTTGDTVPMTLTFEKAGTIVIDAAVKQEIGAGTHDASGGEHGGSP